MSLKRFGYIISLASKAMKKISEASERLRTSATSLDQTTRFNLVELQVLGAMLLNLSLRRIKKSPSLSPFCRLLKQVSKIAWYSDSKWRVGMWM